MANFKIIPAPLGSQFVRAINKFMPEDLNDFSVFIVADANVTGLAESKISVSAGSSLQSFEGQNNVYRVRVRPPETAGIVTITIAANAVSEGNPVTRKKIRVSTRFPDTDAATPTLLWDHNLGRPLYAGIAVTSDIISILGYTYGGRQRSSFQVNQFTHDGTAIGLLTSGWSFFTSLFYSGLIPLNGTFFFTSRYSSGRRIHELSPDGTITNKSIGGTTSGSPARIPDGIKVGGRKFSFIDKTLTDITVENQKTTENGIDFNNVFYDRTGFFWVKDSTNIQRISYANIDHDAFSVYRDTLYTVDREGVQRLDLRPYRPLAMNTKTTIYPILTSNGETIDLKRFCPDAKEIIFSVGYDKPAFLTINTDSEIRIPSDAVTETTPVWVECTGINYADAIDFQFYLIIVPASNPKVRDVGELSMLSGSSFDLFQIVTGAKRITFRAGQTQPIDSQIDDGVFTISTESGTASFTAINDTGRIHFQIKINVVQAQLEKVSSEIVRNRVEIAGIDVTPNLEEISSISESLDAVSLDEYRTNDATVILQSPAGKYNEGIAGNFWEIHSLNDGGYQETINIFKEYLVEGNWVSHLIFSGLISRATENTDGATVSLTGDDITVRLKNRTIEDFGTREKWGVLHPESDEATYESKYVPETSIAPIQPDTGRAWRSQTPLMLREIPLPSEGPPLTDTGYLTPAALHSSGDFLTENPILNYKTQPQSEDLQFLANQLGLNSDIYQVVLDIDFPALETPYILNQGSIGFSVENTRITRLTVDWVDDPINNRILILLSNPEGHISDLLVQSDIHGNRYQVLHTFDKNIKAHRIERRDSANYYILTSKPISQDRSQSRLPRLIDSTVFTYDASAADSVIRIHHYNTATDTLTEHVPEDDHRPPQLSIHYWLGFENLLYMDDHDGIAPDYRGAFKSFSANLYYRYATASEFGVARVNTSGTTTALITQDSGELFNHLNFAFDLAPNGDLYFAYHHYEDVRSTEVVVINNLASGRNLKISDNLSGYTAPLPLIVRVSGPYANTSLYRVEITGTNGLGETITETISGSVRNNSSSTTHRIDTGFQTITRVDLIYRGGQVGTIRVKITAAPIDTSNLVIKKRTAGGTVSTILVHAPDLDALTDLDAAGGYLLGCHEALFYNDFLYMLCPVGRVDVDGDDTTRSRTKAAGMVLYRCDVTAGAPSLTVIEKWDFATRGGCNLVVHEGAVHFMEHPPASAIFKPYNPDLDTYNESMGYNILPESPGALKRINTSGEVDHLGNFWYDDRAWNVAATRPLSISNDLHVNMGYGNLHDVLRFNSRASQVDNVQHLVYGKTLRYVVSDASFNGSIYNALLNLAKLLDATLSIEKNIIYIRQRRVLKADIDGDTGTGTENIRFKNANKAFPASGYLRLTDEFIKYGDINGTEFTEIQRGVLGTSILDHPGASECVHLNTVFGKQLITARPRIKSDTSRLFNVIQNSSGTVRVSDPESIKKHGEKVYTLDLAKLTDHNLAWQEAILKRYLKSLKDLRYLIDLSLKPVDYLQLADVIGFKYDERLYVMQILEITQTPKATTIVGRTLPRAPAVPSATGDPMQNPAPTVPRKPMQNPAPTAPRNLRVFHQLRNLIIGYVWDEPEKSGSSPIAYYEWRTGGGGRWTRADTTRITNTFQATTVFEVRAVNENGHAGAIARVN